MTVAAKNPTDYLPAEVWMTAFDQGSVTDVIVCTGVCREFRSMGQNILFQKRVFNDLFNDAHPAVKSYATSILNKKDSSSLMSKLKRVFEYQVHVITTFSSGGQSFLTSFSLRERITPEFYEKCNEWLHHQHLVFFGLQDEQAELTIRAKNSLLYEIPPELFETRPQVQILDLEHNNISYVALDVLAATTLRSVNLSRNDIKAIEGPEIILESTPLEELDLTINQLSKFPSALKTLPKLTTLLLGHNEITVLSDDIAEMTSLQKLDVNTNRLFSVSPQINTLANLRSLILAHNPNLGKMPELSGLTHLVYLDISHTGIRSLPKGIETLPVLETVDASGNSIRSLPASIGNAKTIKTMNLSKNQIKEIPDEVESMSSLRELHLTGNKIVMLPKTLDRMTGLEKLYMYSNPITLTEEEAKTYPFTIYFKFTEVNLDQLTNQVDNQATSDKMSDQAEINSLIQRMKESFLRLFQMEFFTRFER